MPARSRGVRRARVPQIAENVAVGFQRRTVDPGWHHHRTRYRPLPLGVPNAPHIPHPTLRTRMHNQCTCYYLTPLQLWPPTPHPATCTQPHHTPQQCYPTTCAVPPPQPPHPHTTHTTTLSPSLLPSAAQPHDQHPVHTHGASAGAAGAATGARARVLECVCLRV